MLIFIKVLGIDPDYMQKHQFIAIGIQNHYGVSGEEGDYWRTRPYSRGSNIFLQDIRHAWSLIFLYPELKKLVYPFAKLFFISDRSYAAIMRIFSGGKEWTYGG